MWKPQRQLPRQCARNLAGYNKVETNVERQRRPEQHLLITTRCLWRHWSDGGRARRKAESGRDGLRESPGGVREGRTGPPGQPGTDVSNRPIHSCRCYPCCGVLGEKPCECPWLRFRADRSTPWSIVIQDGVTCSSQHASPFPVFPRSRRETKFLPVDHSHSTSGERGAGDNPGGLAHTLLYSQSRQSVLSSDPVWNGPEGLLRLMPRDGGGAARP